VFMSNSLLQKTWHGSYIVGRNLKINAIAKETRECPE
jgi:hypothetical protein